MFKAKTRRGPASLISSLVAILLLSGCAGSGTMGAEPMPTALSESPLVTIAEVDHAMTRVSVEKDDYTGEIDLYPKNETTVPMGDFWFVRTNAFLELITETWEEFLNVLGQDDADGYVYLIDVIVDTEYDLETHSQDNLD